MMRKRRKKRKRKKKSKKKLMWELGEMALLERSPAKLIWKPQR